MTFNHIPETDLYRDYGCDEEVKYRLFCDPNPDVKTGNVVKYKGGYYTIVRIIAWDDYYSGD